MIDLGNRFRLIVNELEVVKPPKPLPKLPVARAVWAPKPDFKTSAACWIYGGGTHHSGFTTALTTEHLQDFADIAGIELVRIGDGMSTAEFRKELRWNEIHYHLAQGLGRV
jgi:L-arabinose isomerase